MVLDAEKGSKVDFFDDQKDEMLVSLIGGLIFLVWDDETIDLVHHIFGMEGDDHELQPYYYMLVAPVIERIYKLFGNAKSN